MLLSKMLSLSQIVRTYHSLRKQPYHASHKLEKHVYDGNVGVWYK